MTRPRPALSIDAAIARVMAQLGSWAEVARVTGYAHPRQCEKWGAFDIAEEGDIEARDIPMRAAVKLDIAFQAAGGTGAPILEAYADLVKIAAAEAFGDKQRLLEATMAFMHENGEAELALIEATKPDAGEAELAHARKHLVDVREDVDEILAGISARQRAPP